MAGKHPGFGIFDRSAMTPQMADEIASSFQPVRDSLRAAHGETVPLYRYSNGAPEGATPHDFLSMTTDKNIAEGLAGARAERPLIPESEIAAKEAEFAKTGRVQVDKDTWLEKQRDSVWNGKEEVPIEMIAIMRSDGMVTDTPSVREYLSDINQWRSEKNSERAKALSKVNSYDVPVDDIVGITNRFGQKEFLIRNRSGLYEDASPGQALATAGALNERAGAQAGLDVRGGLAGPSGGGGSVEAAQAAAARHAGAIQPISGLPNKPLPVGGQPYVPGPIASVHDVAKSYMDSAGMPYVRQERYIPINEDKSKAIARAFDEMKHAPDDPKVKASYDAMIRETAAQYDAALKSGVKFEPIPPGMADPYAETPRLAAKDVQENNHLWYFPTDQGFGSGAGGSAIDMSKHPMMQKSGRKDIHGNDMLNNDLFRVVHDYFGHLKEGYGFRAAGEDNAWRTHATMYSDLAKPAMTTETRGQNSWVNYGPYGEKNRKASAGDTTYADQKVGLLPDWVWKDELPPSAPAISRGRSQFVDDSGMAIPGPAYTKEAQRINREIAAGPKGEGPLDLTQQAQVPGVEQQPLERYVPPRGISERMQDALQNKKVRKGIQESMEAGRGVEQWYHTEPVRQAFVEQLGPDEGARAFKRYMDQVAATSPRSDVPTNIRNASYYYAGGDPKAKNPYPYGHVAQNLHKQNIEQIAEFGGWDVMQNPKPASFAENLRGNLEPVTVDTHAFRNIGMRTGDPRFLETSFQQKRGPADKDPSSLASRFGERKAGDLVTFRPQELVESGRLSMKEAQKIPSFWAPKPKKNEYAAAEQLFREIGNKVGMRPADAQAAAWAGAGEMTGLGTVGTHTFNELMNERIMFTAKMRGEKPEKVLRDFVTGKKPLLSDTSSGMAFGALDGREEQ